MKQKLLGASRIAEVSGLSRQAITKYFNDKFPDAKVGKKWNVYHAGVFEYLKSKGVDVINTELRSAPKRIDKRATAPVTQKRDKHANREREKLQETPTESEKNNSGQSRESVNGLHQGDRKTSYSPNDNPDISELPDMTLREIAFFHGTDEEFRGWADAFLKVQNGIEKQLKNEKSRGEVISRDYVRRYVFSYMEEMSSRILIDSPAGVVEKLYAMAQSGVPKAEAIPEYVSDMSKIIKAAKHNVDKNIESAK